MEFNASQTIQETLQDSSFLTSNSFNWSIFRDMLCDINQLSPQRTNFLSPSSSSSTHHRSAATRWKRIQDSKLSNSMKLNLLTKTTTLIPPMVKNSFILETATDRYTLIASNKFALWNWILAIKRAALLYLQNHPPLHTSGHGDSDNKNSHFNTSGEKMVTSHPHLISALKILYQYHHYEDHCLALSPHSHPSQENGSNSNSNSKDAHRFFKGNLILHTIGLSNISCQCTLDANTMILSCQASPSEPPIELSLTQLSSISISREYPTHQLYDLQCTCVSGRVSVINLASAVKQGKNLKEFEIKPIESQETLSTAATAAAAMNTSWNPGRILIEGTKLTTSVLTTVVKGTYDGTTILAKGTANLATSAAESLVSIPIAAVGLSLQQNEMISFTCMINIPYARDLITPSSSLTGSLSPYWNTNHSHKINQQILFESNSFGVHEGPSGVIFHLLAWNKSEGSQYILGSKFIPYTELIPKDSLSFVNDQYSHQETSSSSCSSNSNSNSTSSGSRGGIESNIFESTFVLDCEIAFRVDVVKGKNLLPPPRSNSMNTILTHPLDSFVKLSTLATSTVTGFASGTSSTSNTPITISSDRQPRVSCSFVMWKGSPVHNGKFYRLDVSHYLLLLTSPPSNTHASPRLPSPS
jgi:hypothetical protein